MLGRKPTYFHDLTERALSEPNGDSTRDVGPAHSADLAVGAAARVRPQQGDSNELRRNPESGYGIALSRAAPVGAQGMDCGGVEGFRSWAQAARVSLDEE